MPTEPTPPPGPPAASWRRTSFALAGLLLVLSLPDLLSTPVSPTIVRQTQTFSQTRHFVAAGYSPAGLTLDIDGPKPFHVVHEFPLYQAAAGALFQLFGPAFFWGKLVSLAATLAGFWLALQLARGQWGEAVASHAGFFFAASPITLLVSAAFQPDALALALGAAAALSLVLWRAQPSFSRWLGFLLLLLTAALAKFTVLVPFLPLLVAGTFHRQGRWRSPTLREWLAAAGLFVAPFVAWNLYRTTLIDPRYLTTERAMFFIGDLTRFLRPAYYVKPAFILGAMVLCGAGAPLAVLGLRGLRGPARLMFWGLPVYFILLPTAADQTYYAWPLVPVLVLLAARGALRLEARFDTARVRVAGVIAVAWLGGFAVAAPYTLRHDQVSLAAATAVRAASHEGDLVFVMNMHDRGVGIGGFNPAILTLAGRRGWNVQFNRPDLADLRAQIRNRRAEGARWLVLTWFTPDLDPWFAGALPASFSRCPRTPEGPVDGRAIASALARDYPAVTGGANFTVLDLGPAAP